MLTWIVNFLRKCFPGSHPENNIIWNPGFLWSIWSRRGSQPGFEIKSGHILLLSLLLLFLITFIIHIIPKGRPINYSFVCMLISPLRLIFASKFFCFFTCSSLNFERCHSRGRKERLHLPTQEDHWIKRPSAQGNVLEDNDVTINAWISAQIRASSLNSTPPPNDFQ